MDSSFDFPVPDLASVSQLDLVKVYADHIAKGHARGRDGLSPGALGDEILDICASVSEKIRSGTFRFTRYRERLILKGANKVPRVISIPTVRDRIVLKTMALYLANVYRDLRPELPQQKVAKIDECLKDGTYRKYVRADVENFYPSVQHALLMEELSERISDSRVLQLFELAVSTPTIPDGSQAGPASSTRGIPQGLAVSNLLAEVAIHRVDEAMTADTNIRYFRYVDDILILASDKIAYPLRGRLRSLLSDRDFKLNEAKSGHGNVVETFEYLGYVFSNGKISVREASVSKIETSLARLFTKFKYEAKRIETERALRRCIFYVNLRIVGCVHDGGARGWVQYFRQMNDVELINKLDWVVANLRGRFNFPTTARLKSFTRAYWAVKHPGGRHGNYVPNYDEWDTVQKRELLLDLDGERSRELSDAEAKFRFRKLISAAVSDLEKDIGSLS